MAAVAAVSAGCHAAVAAECHAAGSLGVAWPLAAPDGAGLTGIAAARGAVAIGPVAIIGGAEIGTIIGEITTADGVGGTATNGVIPITTLCSLAVLASHGGGAGAGALGQAGDGAAAGAGAAATVTTVTVIRTTVAAMAIPITAMAMDTGMDTVPSFSMEGTETAANPESPNCSAVFHELVTTMDPSTESWGRKLGAQSGTTSKNTVT